MTVTERKAIGRKKIWFATTIFENGKTVEKKGLAPWRPGKSRNKFTQ